MENDTLVSIALKFDTTPGEIARINNKLLAGFSCIHPGQVYTGNLINGILYIFIDSYYIFLIQNLFVRFWMLFLRLHPLMIYLHPMKNLIPKLVLTLSCLVQ